MPEQFEYNIRSNECGEGNKERELDKMKVLELVQNFAANNNFTIRKDARDEYGSKIIWKSEIKKSPIPNDKDMTGLQVELEFAEQLREGGYGWVRVSCLYLYMQPNIKKWLEDEGVPENKTWDDFARKAPYPKDGIWNARVDFYRDCQKENVINTDLETLFFGDVRNDVPQNRIVLTPESINDELQKVLETWNKL